MQIFNISNPNAPTFVGSYDTSGQALGVQVVENYAFIADNDKGLQIIDISNPTAPTLAGSYDTSGYGYGVEVAGNYAYVADGYAGLQIINISNPTAPTLAASYDTLGSAYGVEVEGNYAYVADYDSGLQIINISNPTAPTLYGSYGSLGSAYGVQVVGSYAYIADSDKGLQIIDISNPAIPTPKSNYDTPGYAQKVQVVGNYAYVTDLYSLQIIDIINPSAPNLVGSYYFPSYAYGVEVIGNYAYVADGGAGLQIINISDPSAPTFAGSYDTPSHAYGVEVLGNYAYVADGYAGGLQIINISDPSAPTLAGSYTGGETFAVQVVGNYAYVVGDRLEIIDISNPATPTLVGSYDTFGIDYAQGVQVVGNYAFIAAYNSGLQVINISNPTAPTLAGSYDTSGFAYGVQVMGGYAYVADREGNLKVLDVSDFVPRVSLAVSPGSVTEDGSSPLVYTFTRTGSTDDPLTVNYSVGGTATYNGGAIYIQPEHDYYYRLDTYGNSPINGSSGSITFDAGASTKTLSIYPIADTQLEENETVSLTLTVSAEYVIETSDPVVGTIASDDVPLTPTDLTLKSTAGTEFLVNTTTNGYEYSPSIAMDADGDFVVTWIGSDGDGEGIYARRYSNAGVALGSEFRVNTTTAGNQSFPRIAIDADGDFVIAWTGAGGIYAQRYNSLGSALGSEFQISTGSDPSIAMEANGDFIVTWTGQDSDGTGIYAQRYNNAGVALGSEFRVNTTTADSQNQSRIAMDADGNFIVTWTTRDNDSIGYTQSYVYAQRYDSAGIALGSEFQISAVNGSHIAMDSDGDFVITWTSYDNDSEDNVYAQRYNNAGTALGSPFRVNTNLLDDQWNSKVAMDAVGNFVITWDIGGIVGVGALDGGSAIPQPYRPTAGRYAQRYDSLGVPLGSEFQVHTTPMLSYYTGSIAMSANGNFAIVWSNDDDASSSFSSGVYAQRYYPQTSNATPNTLNENIAANSVIGILSTTDPNAGDTFTYTLVSGEGSTDNTAFSINGDQLQINLSPDYETKSSYDIRLRATDQTGLYYEKPITIYVNDRVVEITVNGFVLSGTPQNDTLDATTDQYTVIPYTGDDTIVVNTASDVILELPNEGTDTIESSVNYNLAAQTHIENLTLTGTDDITGIGNRKNNVITGNSGQNVLVGLQGDDTFVFNFGDSTIAKPDRIRDFGVGADRIQVGDRLLSINDLPSATYDVRTLEELVNSVFTDSSSASGLQTLEINSAALGTYTSFGVTNTYLIANDGIPGFNTETDLIINIARIANDRLVSYL